ncbi:MAG TPA: thiamine phosphate synthase [Roseiarcus sp.]|nr:thiamine phosphate synthase [Roseiarcus sp.]
MPLSPPSPPRCSLYLITPLLSTADANAFAKVFAEVLDAARLACALVRLAPGAQADAKAIVAPLLRAAVAADCALLIENDVRLAARLGADGVHMAGSSADLVAAIEGLKPNRIVGAGSLRMRDDAMTASELGADYVMFGEPRGGARAMGLGSLAERVSWWAEIFETPCVAYADAISATSELARAGADFVALDEAIWSAVSPPEAARQAEAVIAGVATQIP